MHKGLFINSADSQCSIYESGKMIFSALSLSGKYNLDYLEISEFSHNFPPGYDFLAFNYHPQTMRWLNTKKIKRLQGLTITFVLEVSPNNPFVLCPENDFDIYCALDPTLKLDDKRVYIFPRPLETYDKLDAYKELDIPVIGSFGFATPGKGFELLIDAVNREFEKAIVRINIPKSTFADDFYYKLERKNYAEYLSELCINVAKKGIEVKITHEYMSKKQLINWCAQNTLNCFLYNRNQPGLSATTDQAIASGRPLAVSPNETFRHIHEYIKPYPYQTLRQSIQGSKLQVIKMQHDWAPQNFALSFERLLEIEMDKKIEVINRNKNGYTYVVNKAIQLLSRVSIPKSTGKQESVSKISSSEYSNNKILIISHKEKQCGIQQYGVNISEVLKKSKRYNFIYQECNSIEELNSLINKYKPMVVIYNYYPATMPWLTSRKTRSFSMPQLGIMHEVTQKDADEATTEMFDYHLCPDPTLHEHNPLVFKTKRLIPSYINTISKPEIPTIGSFGFGFGDKGFERLIEIVQEEFDIANIKIVMPFNSIVDIKGKKHAILTSKRCHSQIYKKGIKLQISHDFLSKNGLLDFLAGNTINAFLYDTEKNKGISSTIEHALAVQRPIAINKCGMFRHVYNAGPSICIEDNSLKQIISNGIAPLVPFYNEWSEAVFISDYERIVDKVLLNIK